MKRKLSVAAVIVLAGIFATPFLLNLRRVSAYEDRVAHILSYKTENWYLPKMIPDAATNVYYDYTEAWGQGGSSNTLRFRLPEAEARELHAQIAGANSSQQRSDLSRPKFINSRQLKELVWTAFDGNHGSKGGVWYDADKREFVFHHDAW
jgi:hypothetical protein